MLLKDKKVRSEALLNENIPFSHVLLVDGEEKKHISKQEALSQAKKSNLDLFCVAPFATPPVCKLVNYYRINKEKKKPKKNICKEIRISFKIETNDLKVKLVKIQQWIEKGATVKVNLVMVGKEKAQQEVAREKCQKVVQELKILSPKIDLQGNIISHFGSLYFFLCKKK